MPNHGDRVQIEGYETGKGVYIKEGTLAAVTGATATIAIDGIWRLTGRTPVRESVEEQLHFPADRLDYLDIPIDQRLLDVKDMLEAMRDGFRP